MLELFRIKGQVDVPEAGQFVLQGWGHQPYLLPILKHANYKIEEFTHKYFILILLFGSHGYKIIISIIIDVGLNK